jgi:hypothetical protein
MQNWAATVLPKSKAFASKHEVDLAIPNCAGSGIGNALVYTRLVEDWARYHGRPASIITGPLAPAVGTVDEEHPFALWQHNPFVERIVDGTHVDIEGFTAVNFERRMLAQVNHIIENIGFAYGLRPRALRPSLFLSRSEMEWAFRVLANLPRPLVCLHPGGTSRSLDGDTWARDAWLEIIDAIRGRASFFQVGRPEFGDVDLGLKNPAKTLRQTMALIWASDVFVGFDSAPMHIAAAFEIPTVAIFDMKQKFNCEGLRGDSYIPSVMLRWSYPYNRNIAVISDDRSREARDLVIDAVIRRIETLVYRL